MVEVLTLKNATYQAGTPRALVLCGDGINCERETVAAFAAAGFAASACHLNRLAAEPAALGEFQALALPGGFSFGDELGSGQILATKLSVLLGEQIRQFVADGKPVIGICNGFQTLAKMGLFNDPASGRRVALAHNSQGVFVDRWVAVEFPESDCIWTRGLEGCDFPVRHGEGRVMIEGEIPPGCVALRYSEDINGSSGRIAGLCDPTGLVFGLMPHPEAALHDVLHPQKRIGGARGLRVFENAYKYVKETH
ncbi:MAG: phosphoribosylformylglycinamidine synthase [Pseudomonadota bacterium]|jgi:phosphoribosylformylglycinamidine synthase